MMMSSVVVQLSVTKRFTNCHKCCMQISNFSEFKKKENVIMRVPVMRKEISPVVDVENKELTLPLNKKKLQEEIRAKEMMFTPGLGIVQFITGKVFLVTGATGFLAKVLIEKILRTIPDVGKIYLLIKAKDQDAALQRIKTEIINTELFKSLRETHGESHLQFLLSKLVPVAGNICDSNLGMEVSLADHIAKEVDIIINSAGNTTFDERFDVALDTNTLGPCRLLSFAKRCKKLELFLHVSTAYVNGERQGINKEKPFYQGDSIARERAAAENPSKSFPPLDVEAEVKIALDARKDLNAIQDIIVSKKMKDLGQKRAQAYGWQNTYVFTKAMGEMMIDNQKEDIPVVIIRPSVIESTYKEPIPGWIEGIRMLDPLILSYGKGELTGFPMNGKSFIDTVPADMVVNAILAATVKHATIGEPGLSIYHIASSVVNPLVFEDLFTYFFEYFNSCPYMDSERGPIQIERMKMFSSMDEFQSHIQTEVARKSADDTTQGKILSRRLQKSLEIITNMASIYEPYMFYGGRFDNSNTESLLEEMSQMEKKSFGFDVRNIDWKDYMYNIHIPGFLTHVLKGRGM